MTYQDRVQQLESEGCTTSDAQAIADLEHERGEIRFDFNPEYPEDPHAP